MKDLSLFLISNITGSNDISVAETQEEGRTIIDVTAEKSVVGLIIGKEGKTIKNLRRILAIRAAKEDTMVSVNVHEA
ncbi:KH domain-containing protein [Candidatus Woesebacteria bacterium]|jgi:predicted RNA-binding protein YlqC (UPF0109 family)|nr:KH domain-containing protein [Candidatus Woesebacteria bacterium]MBP9687535.1 KH domain-containing protein [Candidatus Woesebacteria bacterium]